MVIEYNAVEKLDLESLRPTDRGNFVGKISDSLKRSILLFGPCKAFIDF